MSVVIGIDIGLTGCISRFGPGLEPELVDIPTIPDGPPRPGKDNTSIQPMRIDGRALLDLLHRLCPAGHAVLAVFEDVRARPMGNDKIQFNTFHSQNSLVLSRGVIQCALDIAGAKAHPVQPQTWKRFFGLNGAEKDDSRIKAIAMWPGLADQLKRKKDHNRAESLLIGHYGLRNLT